MKLNLDNLLTSNLGGYGPTSKDFINLQPQLIQVEARLRSEQKHLGFLRTLTDTDHLSLIKQVCATVKQDLDFSQIVVVGIGGSDLGVRAVHRALNHQFYNQLTNKTTPNIHFMGDTTDPVAIQELLETIDLKQTLFVIISKSGNTIEPAIALLIIQDRLTKLFSSSQVAKHFLMLTDPQKGTLRKLVNKNNFTSLPIPPTVGGRYSVLTAVGLAPLYLVGIDIDQLILGAVTLANTTLDRSLEHNLPLQYAARQYLYQKQGHNITVLMPYIYSLNKFSQWFRQLWAESLGKIRSENDSQKTHVGSTPISALGPTDQHSQLQLYNDGPNDKTFTFITTEHYSTDLMIPTTDLSSNLSYLSGHKLSAVVNQEQVTTAQALTQNQRPNCTITIPELNEYTLGELIIFFELATVYLGYLWEIDPFNQPGVELSKNLMYKWLGRN